MYAIRSYYASGNHANITGRAAYRRDALWLAAMVHRISGVLLALFLPLHFLALGLAIEGELVVAVGQIESHDS